MRNITTAVRYFSDMLEQGIKNEIGDGSDPWTKRLNDSVLPAIIGTKVVMMLSLLERVVIDTENIAPNTSVNGSLFDKLTNLGYTPINTQFEELKGLLSIRHCFAHEFGKITARQSSNIAQFHKDLTDGKIIDERGSVVAPYFTVNNDNIDLQPNISNRLRLICWSIVKHLGNCGLDISKNF